MARLIDFSYIFATIILTVYGQLALKWRIKDFGSLPVETTSKLKFLIGLLLDPVIFSGFAAAFFASLAWMAAMTKFDLSYAYPFMSLNFVLVVFFSAILLSEPINFHKFLGLLLIVLGTIIVARGN